MAKHISNMSQLQKALQPVMKNMVDQLAERVYETLNYYLNDYYTGWTPESYRRTEAFLRSAVKVDAYPDKGGARACVCVYIDYDSMDDYVDTTGYQVTQWADSGYHGGLSVNHKPHVWEDTMSSTISNGSLVELAVKYLRSQGIPVRN